MADIDKTFPHEAGFKHFLRFELALSDNSVAAYVSDTQAFFAYYKGQPESVQSGNIVSFMSYMRKNGAALETILRRLSGISQYFDYLTIEKVCSSNPVEFIVKPKAWRKLPDFLDFSEVELLLKEGDISTPVKTRDNLMIETLYATGMRVSELVSVKIKDIDFKRGIIKVKGKGSKERIVPIYESMINKLETWLAVRQEYFVKGGDNGYLFLNLRGGALSRQHVWSGIKNKCREAGIKKNISPHTLRHCFATHMLSGGADLRTLQIFLGHSNISTTEIYTHVTDDDKRKTIMKFHPRYAAK